MGTGPAAGWVYVGFWRRFVAVLIDAIPLAIVSFALFLPSLGNLSESLFDPRLFTFDPELGQFVPSADGLEAMRAWTNQVTGLSFAIYAVQAVYFVAFWTWKGATLGQLALGIQVRSEIDGSRIGLGRSILRYIGYVVSAWALGIGLIWAAFDRRKQGWHDKIAGTVVVRRIG